MPKESSRWSTNVKRKKTKKQNNKNNFWVVLTSMKFDVIAGAAKLNANPQKGSRIPREQKQSRKYP